MTVNITAQFRRSIPEDSVYRINLDIMDVQNIEFDVLVFEVESGNYSHVATVYDMETYPAGQAAAVAAEVAFFRDRGAVLNFSDVQDATDFETVTTSRLKTLAVDWNTVISDFSGTETVTVDSSTS